MSKRSMGVAVSLIICLACCTTLAGAPRAVAAAPIKGSRASSAPGPGAQLLLTFMQRLKLRSGNPRRGRTSHYRRPSQHGSFMDPALPLPVVDMHRLVNYFNRLRHRIVMPRLHRVIKNRTHNRHLVIAPKIELLSLINAERARAGERPLRFSGLLNAVAQARSQDMTAHHYFSHHIPGVGFVFNILDRDHLRYEMAGENIALNNYIDFYNLVQTVRRTNADFMNSPEHRANILDWRYTEVGLGMVFQRGSGQLIVTEVFVQP